MPKCDCLTSRNLIRTSELLPESNFLIVTLRILWRVLAFLTNTLVCWLLFELALLLAGKRKRLEVINRWVPRWARNNLRIFGVKVDAAGPLLGAKGVVPCTDEQGRGRIFVSNHRSGFDIPILLSLTEAHCISRHDVAQWPIIGRGARRIGTLFVDRERRRSGAAVLKEIAHAVEKGEAVAMFPEGTSHPGDQVHPFRTGAFKAAQRSNVQLVPIGLAYGDDAAYYVDDSFLDHIKRVASLPRLSVAVEIGDPIEPGETETLQLAAEARETIQELVNRARARCVANSHGTCSPAACQ